MGTYMSIEHAKSAHGPVDSTALSKNLSPKQRALLRLGLVRSDEWAQLPTEGIYQIVISEVLETGSSHPLVHSGSRAFAVTAVLDLGLRMLESPRGRQALQSLAHRTINPSHPSSNLPQPISLFLRSVRHRFPAVTLDKRSGFHSNSSYPSHDDMDFFCSSLPSLENLTFNPKSAATLHLNWDLIDKLYWTRLKADTPSPSSDTTIRFKRLQFHLATMVAHHLCHLFIGFLREEETISPHVDETRVLKLVNRYDAGAEFETEFFGGRPKMYIDWDGDMEGRYAGESFLVKRGGDSRRIAGMIPLGRMEDYLRGDFSSPLIPVSEEGGPFELYRDVRRRYEKDSRRNRNQKQGREVVVNVGQSERAENGNGKIAGGEKEEPFSLPWDVEDEEYRLLKKACFDPSVRLVDMHGY